MERAKILIFCFGILFGIQNIHAQTTSPNNSVPDWVRKNDEKRQQIERINNRNPNKELEKTTETPAQRARRIKKQKELEEEKQRRIDEINQKLDAPAEYGAKYADFLKQKNTGIARMFPDKDCDKGLVVTVKELERCSETPQIKGAGSLYSVKLDTIPSYLPLDMILWYIGQSDIHFVGDKFVVGASSTQSIISEIGDANFADINLKSEAFKFLKEFEPSENGNELARQTAELEKGISAGGFLYSNSAPVKLDSVYVLRSISFRQQPQFRNFWNKDIFVAFKIIGRENDGSVIFIWKRLKEKDAPVLELK